MNVRFDFSQIKLKESPKNSYFYLESFQKKKKSNLEKSNNLIQKIFSLNKRREEQSSLERLSKAFGVDSSLTHSQNYRNSNQQREKCSKNSSIIRKTLSFINEDDSDQEEQKKKKQRLRMAKPFYHTVILNDKKYNHSVFSTQESKKFSHSGKKMNPSFSSKEGQLKSIKETEKESLQDVPLLK